jgi:hypothetical protein
VVTVTSPLLVGLLWRKHEIKKSIKSRDAVAQKYMPGFAQQRARQSGEPPQGAGIASKHKDIEHLIKVRDKRAQDVQKM